MKTGKTLVQLATEIERQYDSKQDYVLPINLLTAVHSGADGPESVSIDIPGHGPYIPNPVGHQQVATQLDIPASYYNRMLDTSPDLLTVNLNHWLQRTPTRRMVRTVADTKGTPRLRALVSDSYRRLDNYDLMEAILPVLMELREAGDIWIASAEITDRKLYIKIVTPRFEGEVKRGDVVQSGAVISNSEVGHGNISIQQLIFRLVCLNGQIMPDYGLKRRHVGRVIEDRNGDSDGITKLLSDETLKADDRAFFLKVRDVVRGTLLDGTIFNAALTRLQEASEIKLEGDPVKSVEVLSKKYKLNGDERTGVLRNLIEGADLSMWGVANAITRTSQDVGQYDRATELEALGGSIITLNRNEWREIATAK